MSHYILLNIHSTSSKTAARSMSVKVIFKILNITKIADNEFNPSGMNERSWTTPSDENYIFK